VLISALAPLFFTRRCTAVHIELDLELWEHPKTVDLQLKLNCTEHETIGYLYFFWSWCMRYAEDGILDGYRPEQIARAARWSGEPTVFQQAMQDSGWITEDGRVHAWERRGGKLLRAKEKDARRKREKRDNERMSVGCPSDVRRMSPPDKEKEKEKEKERKDTVCVFALPEWFAKDTWETFLAHRKAVKAPVIPKSFPAFLGKFAKLRDRGWDPAQVVDLLVEKGWRWFKPEWVREDPKPADQYAFLREGK